MKDDERKSGKRDKKDKLKKEKISDKHSKRHSDKGIRREMYWVYLYPSVWNYLH